MELRSRARHIRAKSQSSHHSRRINTIEIHLPIIPEWVWSVFKDQANHSQVSIAGATVNADGSSTKNVDLGRVFVGGAVPAAQVNTLNKTGDDGTYYSVTTSGAATSSVTGRFNPFAITTGNSTVTKSISIGLNTTTCHRRR